MRVLVPGADGFVGSAVSAAISAEHEVIRSGRRDGDTYPRRVDLTQPSAVLTLVRDVRPDVIVNCAGYLDARALHLNPLIVENLLVAAGTVGVGRVLLCGSAAVYGEIAPAILPVPETAALAPTSDYGRSKAIEEDLVARHGPELDTQVVVARLFNPIGPGMHPRLLLSRLVQQLADLRRGGRQVLELTRLDAERDYLHVRDLAKAMTLLVDTPLEHRVYNVGSGVGTTNGALVEAILRQAHLPRHPSVVETSAIPEPTVASRADITRIANATGWHPGLTVDDAIAEILNG